MKKSINDFTGLHGRRDVLKWAGLAIAGAAADPFSWPLDVRAAGKANPLGTARNAIMIEMTGAISQMDTWDLKDTSTTPKDLDPIKIWGDLYLSQAFFPKLIKSKMMDRVSFVRSMAARELAHLTGQYHVQAGRAMNIAVAKEIPGFGSVIAAETDSQRKDSDTFPTYVSTNLSRTSVGAIGSGFFPTRFSGLDIDTSVVFDVFGKKDDGTAREFERRWQRLGRMSEVSPSQADPLGEKASQFGVFYESAHRILSDPRWTKLYQLGEEEKNRYGSGTFGQSCILAKNMLKADAGTRFVYLSMGTGGNGPWDHHTYIYDHTKSSNLYTLCEQWDTGFTALLEDLDSTPGHAPGKTMLDETLIVASSEFGRMPDMNTAFGRDHYAKTYTSLLVGGGVKGQRILGKTNEDCSLCTDTGWKHKEQPVIDNLVATIYSAMGIDWTKKFVKTPSGRAYEYVQAAPIGSNEFIATDPIEDLFT